MDLDFAIARLAHNGAAIDALAVGVDDAQARWRPSPDEWSILEVINHLVDEEREDFRQRVDFTLHRQGEPWPLTDPPGWVCARRYNERDLGESRAYFRAERERSLAWLRGLRARPTGHLAMIIRVRASSPPGICWHRGWFTICCIFASSPNCITPIWPLSRPDEAWDMRAIGSESEA